MLERVRKSIAKYIKENSCTIIVNVRPLKDNGYGKMIPDVEEEPVLKELGIGRIARRRLPDAIITNADTPYDFQDVYYLIVAYDAAWLKMGLIFDYHGQKFRTLFVENRIIGGGVAYKLCNLEQCTSYDVSDFYGPEPEEEGEEGEE